jgi:hypothetical protein
MEKAPMLMRSLSRAAAFLAERVYKKSMMDIDANNSKRNREHRLPTFIAMIVSWTSRTGNWFED